MLAFNSNAIIDTITCPITQCVMKDPVQGNDGHTYEREAICAALAINKKSPMTREPMTISDLKQNYAIKFLCDSYHGLQSQSPSPSPSPIKEKQIILDQTINKRKKN